MKRSADKLRESKAGRLWFNAAQNERWSITDPTDPELNEAMRRLRPIGPCENGGQWPVRTPEEKQRDRDLYRVLTAAEDYQHLTMYALGVEHCVAKLRAIWRGLRERR